MTDLTHDAAPPHAPVNASAESGVMVQALHDWLTEQRWFPHRGAGEVTLRSLAHRVSDVGSARIHDLVVGAWAGGQTYALQVPVITRPQGAMVLDAPIAPMPGSGESIYDGSRDTVYHAYLASSLQWHVRTPALYAAHARVLDVEQSNTCIAYSSSGVVVKILRVLHPGQHPEVLVGSALGDQGCQRVPWYLGHAVQSWYSPHTRTCGPRPHQDGHAAIASEFIGDARNGWSVVTEAAAAGGDAVTEAVEIGRMTAQVHRALAVAPTLGVAPEPSLADDVVALQSRLSAARSVEPERLSGFAEALGAYRELLPVALAQARHTPLQKVHGDFHLGQVMWSPSRGWLAFDFEGEPLRDMSERTQPDHIWRDLAGMVRSFDYAARTSIKDPDEAADWSERHGRAFLSGYGVQGWMPVPLLVFCVDKALYEVVYESQHRPDWVGVPLAGLRQLLRHFRSIDLRKTESATPFTPIDPHVQRHTTSSGTQGERHGSIDPSTSQHVGGQ